MMLGDLEFFVEMSDLIKDMRSLAHDAVRIRDCVTLAPHCVCASLVTRHLSRYNLFSPSSMDQHGHPSPSRLPPRYCDCSTHGLFGHSDLCAAAQRQRSLVRLVFHAHLRELFRLLLRKTRTYEQRDRIMAFFAPIGLLTLHPGLLDLDSHSASRRMYWALGNVGSCGASPESQRLVDCARWATPRLAICPTGS